MKKKYEVLQEEISDCGVCSLESIIKYYGGYISLESLRMNSLTTKDGVTAYNLIECAKQCGFDSQGIFVEKIRKDLLPCIAHLKINKSMLHFVAVYDIDETYIYIMDPASGNKRVSLDEFYNSFTGNVILLHPKEKIIKEANDVKLKHLLVDYFKDNKKHVFLIVIFDLLFILLSLINTTFINFVEKYMNISIVFIFSLLTILISFVNYIIKVLTSKIKMKLSNVILKDFFNHIIRLPLNYIHRKDSGEILKRIEEMELIKDIYVDSIIKFIINICMFISMSIIFSLIINQPNTLIYLIVIVIIFILISFYSNKHIESNVNDSLKNTTDYNVTLVDMVTNIISIIHSNSKTYCANILDEKRKNANLSNHKLNLYIEKTNSIKYSFLEVSQLILNFHIINMFLSTPLSLSRYVICILILNLLFGSIKELSSIIPGLMLSKKIIRKIEEFYSLKEEVGDGGAFSMGDIKINNLSFSYNRFNDIITNFNSSIKKGEKIIIKGESGKGKSTLCKLLNKELLDYQGSIFIDNKNIKDISNRSFRKNVFYVSQNEGIFKGTIKDNILLGRNVDEGYFKTVYSICHLDRVEKKYFFGLDTFVKDGSYLSGGERQLVLLARSLITKPKLLILDEVLSEVNESLEYKIIKDIFKYYKNNTIIYISHKNTCNNLGRIIYV